jgi:DUF971 family protein
LLISNAENSVQDAVPVSLKGSEESLSIEWSDGLRQQIRWSRLRDACPCATCRQKQSEPPPLLNILSPQEAAPVRAVSMRPVGHYAYQISFTDGHNTGIYEFDLLRRLGGGPDLG